MLALKEETCRLNAAKTCLTVSKCWTSLPGDLVEPVKNICPQQHKRRQLFLLADCSVTGQMLFLQPSFCISKWDESPSMKFIEHFHLKVKGCKCMELLRKIIIKKKKIHLPLFPGQAWCQMHGIAFSSTEPVVPDFKKINQVGQNYSEQINPQTERLLSLW